MLLKALVICMVLDCSSEDTKSSTFSWLDGGALLFPHRCQPVQLFEDSYPHYRYLLRLVPQQHRGVSLHQSNFHTLLPRVRLIFRISSSTLALIVSNNRCVVSIIRLIFNVLIYERPVPIHFVSITRLYQLLSMFPISGFYCIYNLVRTLVMSLQLYVKK